LPGQTSCKKSLDNFLWQLGLPFQFYQIRVNSVGRYELKTPGLTLI